MSSPILFYDILGSANPRKTWSPNTQKTRYSLNYKGLPYKTVWVELADIQALGKKLGVKPTTVKDGQPWFTLPIIYDPSTDTPLADSFEIAKYLDRQYPDRPTLIPPGTDALQSIFIDHYTRAAIMPMYMLVITAVGAQLSAYSMEYYRRTRERWFGKLEEIRPPGAKRIEGFKEFKSKLDELGTILDKNGQGKRFVMGDTITLADFHLSAFFIFFKLMAPEGEWNEFAYWHDGRWVACIEALKEWEEGVGDETEIWKPE